MGTTKSIEEKAAEDKAFQDWLDAKTKDIESQLKVTVANLEEKVKKYYAEGDWDDYKPFIEGIQVDTLNSEEWSLDNVNRILSEVQSAMFGTGKPPQGIKIENETSIAPSIAMMGDLRLYVLGKAFEAIQGILQVFSTSSKTSIKQREAVEMIAPGMTMFISIKSASYENTGFFTRQVISQYFYVFKVYFSNKQAGDISKFNDLMAYEDLKVSYRNRIRALATLIDDPMTDFDAITQLDSQLEFYAKKLEDIQKKIEQLAAKELAAIRERKSQTIQFRRKAALKDQRVASLPAPSRVFTPIPGSHPVRVEDSGIAPFYSVGLLRMQFPNGNWYMGSGTVVALEEEGLNGQFLLTCAHNLYDSNDGGVAKRVTFQPGRNGAKGPMPAMIPVEDWRYPKDYEANSISRLARASGVGPLLLGKSGEYDYALARLRSPLAVSTYPTPAAIPAIEGKEAELIGLYGWDELDTTEMFYADGPVDFVDDTLLGYPISSRQGASGSGLFLTDRTQIAGVHIFGGTDRNFARRMTRKTIRQINDWANEMALELAY